MFTGIIQACGDIVSIEKLGQQAGMRLTIDAADLDLTDVQIGDSIAIQGACMTVVRIDGNCFDIDISVESLSKTVGLDAPAQVNLEKALRLSDRIGGHLVSGHVDGLGEVVRFEQTGESWELCIQAPKELAKFLAYKGSVTINGVSLTVNSVDDNQQGCQISINLIPHTVEVTTLKHIVVGDSVNLEIDLIARYVQRLNEST